MTRAATVQICDGPACGYDLGLIAPNIPDDCVGYRSKFLHSAPASLGAHLRRDRVLRGPAVPPRFLFRVTAHSVLANSSLARSRLARERLQNGKKALQDHDGHRGCPGLGQQVVAAGKPRAGRHGERDAASRSPLRRLEARYGVPWRTFWQLRYRPPADVFVGVYLSLKAAYEAECERQERLLRHEREITKAKVQAFEALGSATAEPPRRESDLT